MFKQCTNFHGHICPGLSIGFKAATTAMETLKSSRAEDEELLAIVETDACCADAVQVVTGCTFGKGNFIYKDHGKMVFTFLNRKNGKGIRIALKNGAFSPNEEHFALLKKVINNTADAKEEERFRNIHFKRSSDVLEMAVDDLFTVESVEMDIPDKAKIARSETCGQCGEPTMETKLMAHGNHKICRDCFDKLDEQPTS
jgi:formylmethanofuran dehydrogenase subunit E